ncbi:MAG: hypothetical protein RL300_1876 [Pseudomonadota bacterium]|jgi:general secretion pathway protein B
MSYILDALKRADAERERGAAPGLHTRHQISSNSPTTSGANRPLWHAVAGGAVLLALAAAFWFWRAPANPPPIAETPAVASVTNAPVVAAPKVQVQLQPLTPPAPARTTAEPSTKPVTPAKVAVSEPAKAAGPAATSAATAPAVAPLLADLPQDLRSQIPKITISGSVYSDSPAQRLLLVNNLVLPQGSQLASDLTLEEIQRSNSVFVFRGTRFRVMH